MDARMLRDQLHCEGNHVGRPHIKLLILGMGIEALTLQRYGTPEIVNTVRPPLRPGPHHSTAGLWTSGPNLSKLH